jgi:hypothetical protein
MNVLQVTTVQEAVPLQLNAPEVPSDKIRKLPSCQIASNVPVMRLIILKDKSHALNVEEEQTETLRMGSKIVSALVSTDSGVLLIINAYARLDFLNHLFQQSKGVYLQTSKIASLLFLNNALLALIIMQILSHVKVTMSARISLCAMDRVQLKDFIMKQPKNACAATLAALKMIFVMPIAETNL